MTPSGSAPGRALCVAVWAAIWLLAAPASAQRAAVTTSGPTAGNAAASMPVATRCTGAGSRRVCVVYYREGICVHYRGARRCQRYPARGGRTVPSASPGSEQASAAPTAGGAGRPTGAGMVTGETAERGARTLDGLTFAYPRFFPSAFVATSMHVGAGVELYQQDAVQTMVDTGAGQPELFEFDRDLVFARLRANLDIAPADVFSFGAGATYLAQVGANEQSLFLYGAETGYRIEPRLKLRLLRNDRAGSQLGLQAYGTFSGGLRAVPQGLMRELALEIAAIAQDQQRVTCLVAADFECAFDNVDLVTAIQLHRTRVGAGGVLSYAQAVSSHFGLQLAAGFEGAGSTYSWRYLGDIDAGSFRFSLGASPQLNLYPDAPVGVSFEYRFEVEHSSFQPDEQAGIGDSASNTATGHRLAIGLQFTGRRDLMLGALLALSFVDEAAEIGNSAADQPAAFVVAPGFDMRYFF